MTVAVRTSFSCVPLDPRADRLDVGLVDLLGARQRHRRGGDVGVSLAASSVACIFGWPTRSRLAAAEERIVSCGWNSSASQAGVWKGAEAVKELQPTKRPDSPPPFSVAVDCNFAQLVGLRVNSLRLRLSSIDRMLSWAPPKTSGIGSETAVTCVVSGSTKRATRTTTVPRSKGPAVAGVITARERGARGGGREEDLAGDREWRRAGAGLDRRDADFALRRAAGVSRLVGAAGAGRGGDRARRAVRDARQLADDPRRQGDRRGFQLLLSVAAGERYMERAVGAGLGAFRRGGERGGEGARGEGRGAASPPGVAWREKLEVGVAAGLPDHGVIAAPRRVRAAGHRAAQHRLLAARS